jgi:hypothetical protein
MFKPWSPVGGEIGTVLGFFIALTVALHAVFVYWRPLSKRWWKRLDYVWLTFAALGLVGAAAEVRRSTANSQLGLFQDQASRALRDVHGEAEFLSRSPGVLCRTFTRSEYSPPPAEFDRIQSEYTKACDWAKKVEARLPREISVPLAKIDTNSLPQRPVISESEPIHLTDDLYRQIEFYNSSVQTVRGLAGRSKRENLEWTLILLGPFLLAIALAIRFTKVTGELRLER